MQHKFTKMHGLGNDFIVFDFTCQPNPLTSKSIQALANRKTGIGFDQLLIIETATAVECDFRYRIYNADGSEVEHCGNGVRCVANYILDHKLSKKPQLRFQMAQGTFISTTVLANGLVTVDMQPPIITPAKIPFIADTPATIYSLDLPERKSVEISAVSMGNPHAILIVEDVDLAPLETLGPIIEHHPRFPNRTNVGFMEIIDPATINLRVFERGVGETLACGTGACAAVVAGQQQGLLDQTVNVQLTGGTLNISWNGEDSSVFMTGPTTTVFEGLVDL